MLDVAPKSFSPADFQDRISRLRLIIFDFDGVFTDNMVYVLQDGTEAVRCSRSDGIGLRRLERAGITAFILSTETNLVVAARAAKLGVGFLQGVEDKLFALQRLLHDRQLSFDQVGFVGNDINDRPCLSRVGFPVVVADAHPDVLPLGYYTTRLPGGHGAVREVCDVVAQALGVPAAYAAPL